MKLTVLNKRGFSLAEALVTLLIVCLITIAMIPILTKKKRNLSNTEHGMWMCTLNSAGKHVYWSKEADNGDSSNPETWTVAGNSCKFTPPSTARNFSITAAAGGGGGAGAESKTDAWTSDFAVKDYGVYKVLAVGGGGQGGDANCGRGGGGGAGGIGFAEYEADETVTQIKISRGSANSSSNQNGVDGSPSVVTAVYKAASGNMQEKTIVSAGGGFGGGGRWHGWTGTGCVNGSGRGGAQGSVTGIPGVRSYNSSSGKGGDLCDTDHCFGYTVVRGSTNSQENINKLISPYSAFVIKNSSGGYVGDQYISQIGRGGDPNTAKGVYGRTGQDGIAIVMTEIYKSGGGGKTGEAISQYFKPSFNEKSLEIIVGAGGEAGKAKSSTNPSATKGGRGGDTKIGTLLGLKGGNGGTLNYATKTLMETPGEDGQPTPLFYNNYPEVGLGGLSGANTLVDGLTSSGYGAGGGGGGLKPNSAAGNGAKGSPGVVIIEW